MRLGASSPQSDGPPPQLLGHCKPVAKGTSKSRCDEGRDTRRRKRRSNSNADNGRRDHHPVLQHRGDDHTLDPSVEAAMLRVLSSDGKNRGVSVSAIRRLYRKRHEEEKARAMEEVRRWWRVGRSEAVPLAEATVAASLMLASRDAGAQNCPAAGTTAAVVSGLAENGTVIQQKGHIKLAMDALVAEGAHATPSRREHDDSREQAHYRTFHALDSRQLLQDPSHAASVVRDVKQALRVGQSVKIRCRQESSPSHGRQNSADNQLVLRTLYMQCVRVSDKEVNGGSSDVDIVHIHVRK